MKKHIVTILFVFTMVKIATIPECLNAADIHHKIFIETYKIVQKGSIVDMVWWIPSEYWKESFKQANQITEQRKEYFIKIMDEYSLFAVFHIDLNGINGIAKANRQKIIQNVELEVKKEIIPILGPNEISTEASDFLHMMKPIISKMSGQVGQAFEFLAYPNKRNGTKIIEPLEKGSFKYTSFGNVFRWRLPLASLLPPVHDQETGEEFPGNFIYNPFTGEKMRKK